MSLSGRTRGGASRVGRTTTSRQDGGGAPKRRWGSPRSASVLRRPLACVATARTSTCGPSGARSRRSPTAPWMPRPPSRRSRGCGGAVTFTPREFLALSIQGATLDRPLEFRFDESSLHMYGLNAEYRASSRMRVQLDASRYAEDRQRPDAAGFDWNQVRVSARMVLLFGGGSDTDLGNMPPAVRRMPGGREE